MRHRGLRNPPVGKGVTRDAEFADDNGQAHDLTLTPEHQTHFGKVLFHRKGPNFTSSAC